MSGIDIIGIGKVTTNPAEALERVLARISAGHSVRQGSRAYARADWPRSASAVSSTDFDALIAEAATRVGLDPALVRAVVAVESGFQPNAVSPAGAKGLMQLMDATAASLGVRDSFDPAENLRGGTEFLRYLINRYGDERLALAAYNAGPGAVDRYGGIPPYEETQRYVGAVLAEWENNREWRA